jgi:hypothetical protein
MEKHDFIVGEDEIIELTGFVIPSKQRETLDRMGIRYFEVPVHGLPPRSKITEYLMMMVLIWTH